MNSIVKTDDILNSIYTIQGKQVMLDKDLAVLYNTETRTLKQAVKRNIKRFPDDFMFQLADDDINTLVSQSVIPSKSYFGASLKDAGKKWFVFSKLEMDANGILDKLKGNDDEK